MTVIQDTHYQNSLHILVSQNQINEVKLVLKNVSDRDDKLSSKLLTPTEHEYLIQ